MAANNGVGPNAFRVPPAIGIPAAAAAGSAPPSPDLGAAGATPPGSPPASAFGAAGLGGATPNYNALGEGAGGATPLYGGPGGATPPFLGATPRYGGPFGATPPFGAAEAPYTPPMYGAVTPAGAPATPPYGAPAGLPGGAGTPVAPPPALPGAGDAAVRLHSANANTILSRKVLDSYFNTFDYPFTRHHIDSYDQFLTQDLPAIIKSNNPFLLLKGPNAQTNNVAYKVEVFVGGLTGQEIYTGTPTLSLQRATEVRVMFPNEARLRNLTYGSTIYADILVRVTITAPGEPPSNPQTKEYKRLPLFQLPMLLHSRFCLLHGKPASFLEQAGECPQDQGGYFIIDGSEKILISRQEQAFNTLYIRKQNTDPQIETYGNITCLSPITRQVKVVTFYWMRQTGTLQVILPFVRKPVPIFVLFRAFGVQTDEDILRLIYPNLDSSEAKSNIPLLLPSIAESFPFLDQFSAIQFIKAMTKGFSEYHVYDILYNQTFIHITDTKGGSRVHFLAECVRQMLRVHTGEEAKTDRDDIRNQRILTSGTLIRMLFNTAYTVWKKKVRYSIDSEYENNRGNYALDKFMNIFSEGNTERLWNMNLITEHLMRGFKGKWATGGAGGGGSMGHSDEKTGVLQSLSRLSYLDFMSHTRRLNLNFDTGMKLTGPRQLHGSQYGYFCTNETPSGASIGVTKNLSLMTLISTATDPRPLTQWFFDRSYVIPCSQIRPDLQQIGVAVYLNNGILGYTLQPEELTEVLKLFKWTGCLSALASVGFNRKTRKVFVFLDEGRPCRPLIHLNERGAYPKDTLNTVTNWRTLVMGTFGPTLTNGLSTVGFFDPLQEQEGAIPLAQYKALLKPHVGVIEYVDPYEQNEILLVSFPEHITKDTSHCEIHPSTILSIVNGMIPFANYNQSPRNQLSCSQSKQGLSLYATNFYNRFDGAANVLCYGEAPLIRTYAFDKLGGGQMPYGANVILAICPFHGFNRDDGIIFNLDSFQRGLFRSINYRSYEAFEEIDKELGTRTTIANPLRITAWLDIRPGVDYTKLDERGIIKVGELVDETTVLVGRYAQDRSGKIKDASVTAQVWTHGRVESVSVTVNNEGLLLVKIRITQDRVPELGDKFSTRHGQKGTMGMGYRAHDMPRTANGLVPDMIVNPHCIPSRMTVAQLLEMLFGKACYTNTMIGDATTFTTDETAAMAIGNMLEGQYGMERAGNEILYDGETGVQMPTSIFMGPCFAMRLKHMTEDKWNARAEGRREQKTHQPTGGRGAQGGLRIGEMERDAIAGHGAIGFLKESLMERSDKTTIRVCNGCGTVPIYNETQGLFVCSLCDGPVRFIGTNANNLEILPTAGRSIATSSLVEIPYATKLLADELQTYMNMGLRFLTTKGVSQLKQPAELQELSGEAAAAAMAAALPEVVFPETRIPEYREAPAENVNVAEEDLVALGVLRPGGGAGLPGADGEEEEEGDMPFTPVSGIQKAWSDEEWARRGLAPPTKAYYGKKEWVNAGYPNSPPYVPGVSPVAAAAALPGRESVPMYVHDRATGYFTKVGDPERKLYDGQGREVPLFGPRTPEFGPGPVASPMYQTEITPPELAAQYNTLYQAAQARAPGDPNEAFRLYMANKAAFNASAQAAALGAVRPAGAPLPVEAGTSPLLPMGGGGQQMLVPAPIVYQAPVPQLPPTIIIDTGPRAMSDMDFVTDQQAAARGQPVMGQGGGGGAHRAHRATQRRTGGGSPPRGSKTFGGEQLTPSTRIQINKLG